MAHLYLLVHAMVAPHPFKSAGCCWKKKIKITRIIFRHEGFANLINVGFFFVVYISIYINIYICILHMIIGS